MKKKGLIIATIVMVLVLAVSLTTATYAWFTVSDVTTITGFGVEITTNQKVEIGLMGDTSYVYDTAKTTNNDASMFVYGDVRYTAPTGDANKGVLGGTWTGGTPGLGGNVTHNIVWGAQTKAVGMTAETLTPNQTNPDVLDGATYGGTGLLTQTTPNTSLASGKIIAANGQQFETGLASKPLEQVTYAVANGTPADGSTPAVGGDYAYLYLGVRSLSELTANDLVLTLTPSDEHTRPNLGILAAIHVAVKVNDGNWTDYQFYKGVWDSDIKVASADQLNDDQKNAYADATGGTYDETIGSVVINLKDATKTVGKDIAHVQIIIYIAGYDTDCNTAAIANAGGDIDIFFNTVTPSV